MWDNSSLPKNGSAHGIKTLLIYSKLRDLSLSLKKSVIVSNEFEWKSFSVISLRNLNGVLLESGVIVFWAYSLRVFVYKVFISTACKWIKLASVAFNRRFFCVEKWRLFSGKLFGPFFFESRIRDSNRNSSNSSSTSFNSGVLSGSLRQKWTKWASLWTH